MKKFLLGLSPVVAVLLLLTQNAQTHWVYYQTEYGSPPGCGERYAGRVIRAVYGAAGKYADVTGIVQRFAREGIRFEVSNQTFGVDPNYGVHKHLRVIMMGLDGMQFEISQDEGESIRL
jgi:hypothetical protein